MEVRANRPEDWLHKVDFDVRDPDGNLFNVISDPSWPDSLENARFRCFKDIPVSVMKSPVSTGYANFAQAMRRRIIATCKAKASALQI